MKNLRRRFERFCFANRSKGIPNLMLYITLGSGMVYLFTLATQQTFLYNLLCFDRALILQGEVWRLITYPLVSASGSNPLMVLIFLVCYYSLGRAMENIWGTLRFNLYYLSGVLLMDIYAMLFGGYADAYYLNLSLFLGYATLYPDAHFLLLFIIPVRAWIFAVLDLALIALEVIQLSFPVFYFPYNLLPLVSIANYFLFFGKDFFNIFPISWRVNASRLFRKNKTPVRKQQSKVIRFDAGSYQASTATPKAPYTHRCTVCGRTDVSNPELEFRYCSKCNGYFCYCEEHISNHNHIE